MGNAGDGTKINWKVVAFILVIVGAYVFLRDDVGNHGDTVVKVEDQEKVQEKAAPSLVDRMPSQEIEFVKISQQAMVDSKSAKNDMQVGGIKATRDQKICTLITEEMVSGWVGKVETISSNSDGKGVFAVELANDLTLKTWNNDFSDSSYGTLLTPGTDIFSTASNLSPGDFVMFSGTFFKDDRSCLRERSLSLGGKVKSPEFIFKFTNLQKI